MTIRPESARHTANTIARDLRDDILAGRLEPGQPLREIALSERFEVSRGPVRDALRTLAESGLASVTPNAGARVRQLSGADAMALYELREALEVQAAGLAARRAGPEALQTLTALLNQHEGSVNAHPAGAYLTSGRDTDFHVIIAQMAGNPLLLRELSEALYPQIMLLRWQHRNVQGRGQIALTEHRRIVDAIADGDEDVARLQMRRHIRNSWASLRSQIGDDAPTEPRGDR